MAWRSRRRTRPCAVIFWSIELRPHSAPFVVRAFSACPQQECEVRRGLRGTRRPAMGAVVRYSAAGLAAFFARGLAGGGAAATSTGLATRFFAGFAAGFADGVDARTAAAARSARVFSRIAARRREVMAARAFSPLIFDIRILRFGLYQFTGRFGEALRVGVSFRGIQRTRHLRQNRLNRLNSGASGRPHGADEQKKRRADAAACPPE